LGSSRIVAGHVFEAAPQPQNGPLIGVQRSMAHASDLTQELLRRQNTDGGWGYQGKTSWTEPTALAVLALESLHRGESRSRDLPHARGIQWLLTHQQDDGGWAPNPIVNESTSVTSTASLAISGSRNQPAQARAVQWILKQIKPKLSVVASLKFELEGMPSAESVMGGSPWYPGTACWIAPTAMSVVALTNARRASYSSTPALDSAVEQSKRYILSRQCVDGGWNHGGTHVRSSTARSYPEMTGMALLALDETEQIEKSLRLAEQMQSHAESSEGQSWLTLALCKHRRTPVAMRPMQPHTTRDLALHVLALSASSPSNRLLGVTL
jgi:Prenyltransferase and squalene oxidase repeat